MNIKSLTLKNQLVDENTGESYFDLTAPSFIYDADLGVKALHYVMSDQVGRLDKISEIYFGSSENIDAICVINNIFNPFSIQEGDVLVIPNLRNPDLVYQRPNTASRPAPAIKPYTDTGRQSQKDQSRIQRLLQKAKEKKSGVNTPILPNMLQPNQSAKLFNSGEIKLGSNLPSRNTLNNNL
jgi:hypothetical protein